MIKIAVNIFRHKIQFFSWRSMLLPLVAVLLIGVAMHYSIGKGQHKPASNQAQVNGRAELKNDQRTAIRSRQPLVPSESDPFIAALENPSPIAAAASAAPQPTEQAVRQIPTLDVTFAGRIVRPDGTQVILMTDNQGRALELVEGLILPSGFALTTLEKDSVSFLHASTNTLAKVTFPPLPAIEVR